MASNASMLVMTMACALLLVGSTCHAARNLADTTPAAAAPAASAVPGLPAVPTDTVTLMPPMPSVTLPTVPQVTLPPMPSVVVPKAVLPPMPKVTLPTMLQVTMAPMPAIVVPKVALPPLLFVPNVNVPMPFAAVLSSCPRAIGPRSCEIGARSLSGHDIHFPTCKLCVLYAMYQLRVVPLYVFRVFPAYNFLFTVSYSPFVWN
ncbi:uncharacterized protein [Aegilops tauschii subsp. strangulata]|nr:protein PELPK1-like [Aegilops tauschii subsp. strangulata]